MKKNLVIFDADSQIFIIANRHKRSKVPNMVKMSVHKFIKDCIEKCEENTPGDTDYMGFFGKKSADAKPNFRYDIDPQYKCTRGPVDENVEKWRPTIHDAFIDKWGFLPVDGMEADDACGIMYEKYKDQYENIYVVTADKDLKQFHNVHWYNISKHSIEFFDTFKADHFFAYQMLMGDTGDDIPGLYGIGPKKAAGMIADCKTSADLKWTVLRAYASYEEVLLGKSTRAVIKANKADYIEQINAAGAKLGLELADAQVERKLKQMLDKAIKAEMEDKFPGGWKKFIKQQYALLHMLREIPTDCELVFPEPTEFEIVRTKKVSDDELDDKLDDILDL